ncbi:MAG: dihydroneopterin aldolase [Chloroflexi bacterium 13_1_40CM_4_68_4]|nr:MAG: dihydroneopterin aldolase [Chloroflexi bacterium 13_1_40CM_4_68_4]
MRFYARHGVHRDERELGQTYRVDVALTHDLAAAGRTDDLARTIDYGVVHRLVKEVVEGAPRNLVEAVAEAVADTLLAGTPARSVWVRVVKPHPPIAGADLDEEAVEIERTR